MNRRERMLEALGIGTLWQLRPIGDDTAAATAQPAPAPATAQPTPVPATAQSTPVPATAQPTVTLSAVAGSSTTVGFAPAPSPDPQGRHTDAEIAAMDWDQLQSAVAGCTRCRLCETRNRTVFGVGDPKAQWLFVGEGPGRSEDQQGEPFVGPAGKLLDNMLAAMALRRGRNAFIANVVKCRPTDAAGKDRAPAADEAAACRPYLDRQIALIGPRIVLALGKTAATALLASEPSTTLAALRGRVHRYGPLPLVVTYHPAYLLRVPADKRKTWEDLCLALAQREGDDSR